MTHDELMALAMKAAEAELAWDIASSKHPEDKKFHGVDKARAALSEALKHVVQDAERYRWLLPVLTAEGGADEFDAAIDAAMKESV